MAIRAMVRSKLWKVSALLVAIAPIPGAAQQQKKKDLNVPFSMPNLGRGFTLGSLYDARIEQRVGGFLWPQQILKNPTYVKEVNSKNSRYKFAYDDTFSDRASMMEMGNSLSVKVKTSISSFGSGGGSSVDVGGSAKFLGSMRQSSKEVSMSVAYRLRSYTQSIDVFHPDVKSAIHANVVGDARATHVVASVQWGSDCIATFSKKTSSLKMKSDYKQYLKVAVSTMTDVNVPVILDYENNVDVNYQEQNAFSGQSFDSSSGVQVQLHGDVLPFGNETLPTDVQEAIRFMKRLHKHGIADGGVPMDLTLIPIEWLDSKAAKVTRKIESQKIDESLEIFNELDESIEELSELLEIPNDGFLAWENVVKKTLTELKSYRAVFTQQISEALDEYQNGAGTDDLTNLFVIYRSGNWTRPKVTQLVELRRDEIINLKSLVATMKSEGGVKAAEHFSDYMAPSLNQDYAKVYVLLLTGMNPSRHRSSISLVRDFTSLAATFLTSVNPLSYCLQSFKDGQAVCLEQYMFLSIHFDSFCEQFCKPEFCNPVHECTDGKSSSKLDFVTDRDAWCQNPCTLILEFPNNQAPIRADTRLPVKPGKPTIDSVDGAQDTEVDPYFQKVTLKVSTTGRGIVQNFKVRVIWLERDSSSGWLQTAREFTTTDDRSSIIVRSLTAGRRYTFQVAGINRVGTGPFSDEFRTSDNKMVLVGYTMATIQPVEPYPVEVDNVGPAWKDLHLKLTLSLPGVETIGIVKFLTPKSVTECLEYSEATTQSVKCKLPRIHLVNGDQIYTVLVMNENRDEELGYGNFTQFLLTGKACHTTETTRRRLCQATAVCVSDCSECQETSLGAGGIIVTKNTSENTREKLCTSDVCPDNAGKKVWCPASQAVSVCFVPGAGLTDASCMQACHPMSTYNAQADMCALPCNLHLTPSGVSQHCASIKPGQTCNIGCVDGYKVESGDSTIEFKCPADNSQEDYKMGDPMLAVPKCAAKCSKYKCPLGWKKQSGVDHVLGDSNSDCCTFIPCIEGQYRPPGKAKCVECKGETRRRRVSTAHTPESCTGCPAGKKYSSGLDDCDPYCKGYSCSAPWAPKTGKDALTGSRREDCCNEIICGAGYYHPSGSTACHGCSGMVRRRRATSCSRCDTNRESQGGSDDCKLIMEVSGYKREPGKDCTGGNMPNGDHRSKDLHSCRNHCNGRWDCGGFSYNYGSKHCIVKWLGRCKMTGSNSWVFFKKR